MKALSISIPIFLLLEGVRPISVEPAQVSACNERHDRAGKAQSASREGQQGVVKRKTGFTGTPQASVKLPARATEYAPVVSTKYFKSTESLMKSGGFSTTGLVDTAGTVT